MLFSYLLDELTLLSHRLYGEKMSFECSWETFFSLLKINFYSFSLSNFKVSILYPSRSFVNSDLLYNRHAYWDSIPPPYVMDDEFNHR